MVIRDVDESNGDIYYNGDNLPATSASIWFPYGVDIDNEGNLYIADNSNNRIRKVDTSGYITTFAGNGHHVYNGDGIPATLAAIQRPRDVLVASNGDVYITDTGNHRIRRVDAFGIIHTVVGTGWSGSGGDGGPAINAYIQLPWGLAFDENGILYVADDRLNAVIKIEEI